MPLPISMLDYGAKRNSFWSTIRSQWLPLLERYQKLRLLARASPKRKELDLPGLDLFRSW